MSELEQAFIGSLISKPENIVYAVQSLKDGDLKSTNAMFTFAAIEELFKKNESVDIVTVSEKVNGSCNLSWIAGSTDIGIPQNFKRYLRLITEAGKKRRISEKLKAISADIKTFDSDIILDDILTLYNQENFKQKEYSPAKSIERFDSFVKRNKELGNIGHLTGFSFLDDLRQFYCPNHCWVIGGNPGAGKTMLVIEMLNRMSRRIKKLVFETEMTEEQLVMRSLANKTGVRTYDIMMGRATNEIADRIEREKKNIASGNTYIYDDIRSIEDIEAECLRHDYQGGVDIVVIDYVQDLRIKGTSDEYASQTAIAERLQELMKRLRATGIFFSQLPNEEKTKDSGGLRFKGSGKWYEIADVGVRILTDPQNKRHRMWSQRKHRHGAELQQMFLFNEQYTGITDILHEKNEVY